MTKIRKNTKRRRSRYRGVLLPIRRKARYQKSATTYKDTLFRVLFAELARAIELVNALENTNYPMSVEAKLLELTDSLARRYNDSAIVIDDRLFVLTEHQSTINPNMPIRLLPNVTDILYSYYVDMKKIYGTKLVKIPTPKFYVLYNGKDALKSDVLKLSDAFIIEPGEFSMNLIIKVIDIRYENGDEILEKSPSLKGYSYLISLIHKYIRTDGMERDKAIHRAIERCIKENVLAGFLRENFWEVASMLNIEYNQEDEYQAIREEGLEEGILQGKIELYFTRFKFDIQQIADELKIGRDEVNTTLSNLGLV